MMRVVETFTQPIARPARNNLEFTSMVEFADAVDHALSDAFGDAQSTNS